MALATAGEAGEAAEAEAELLEELILSYELRETNVGCTVKKTGWKARAVD
jgi:hypothetical protein